jgi:hypothetical protein
MKSYPAPSNSLPPPSETYDPSSLARTLNDINRVASSAVTKNAASSSLLLQSPDGSVYKVEVDNSGNLTTSAVSLGQQGSPPY